MVVVAVLVLRTLTPDDIVDVWVCVVVAVATTVVERTVVWVVIVSDVVWYWVVLEVRVTGLTSSLQAKLKT